MPDIEWQTISHSSAWTNRSIGGLNGLTVELSKNHIAAIDQILASTRHLEPRAVTRREFDHPALNGFLGEMFEIIKNGRGVVLIKGVTRDKYSDEDCERIYWGFGLHWGRAVMQSPLGDRLGHVRYAANNLNNRSYRSNGELTPHTDANDVVGLMCLEQAASGGESQVVSSLAIYNELLRTKPQLLTSLYDGYNYAIREHASESAVTEYKIPVFCFVGGKVSCQFVNWFIYMAAERMKTSLPLDLKEAIEHVEELSTGEDLRLDFHISPGEMLFMNNYTNLHSRSKYQDSDVQKRHLLRMWLHVPDFRPVVAAYRRMSNLYRFGDEKTLNDESGQ